MRLLKRVIASPTTHVLWAVFVVGALFTAYHIDPYVFGFTAIILGWVAVGVGAIGIAVIVLSKSMSRSAKVAVACSLVLSVAALATAFSVLRGFKWA